MPVCHTTPYLAPSSLPPEITHFPNRYMTLEGPLDLEEKGTTFGPLWPGPQPLGGAGVATSSSGTYIHTYIYIPVPFWQMKPCVSSVQLRSSQRPVKWAEGLCRTTAQLVWEEGATQGNPGAFDTTAPWKGGWG